MFALSPAAAPKIISSKANLGNTKACLFEKELCHKLTHRHTSTPPSALFSHSAQKCGKNVKVEKVVPLIVGKAKIKYLFLDFFSLQPMALIVYACDRKLHQPVIFFLSSRACYFGKYLIFCFLLWQITSKKLTIFQHTKL